MKKNHLRFAGIVIGMFTGMIIALNNPYTFEGPADNPTFQPAILLFASFFAGLIIAFKEHLLRTPWLALLVSLGLGIFLGISGTGMHYSSWSFTILALGLLIVPAYYYKLETKAD